MEKFDFEYYKNRCKHLEEENYRLKSTHERIMRLLLENAIADSYPPSPSHFVPMRTSTEPPSPILGSGGKFIRRQLLQKPVDPDETFWEPPHIKPSIQEKTGFYQLSKKDYSDDAFLKKKPVTTIEVTLQKGNKQEEKCGMLLQNPDEEKSVKFKQGETSYDKLPKVDGPNYAFKEKSVRGVKRKLLPAQECSRCAEFFKVVDVTGGMKKNCSKHRSKYGRAHTPQGFWDLSLPSTQEIRKRQAALPSPEKTA